MVREEQRDWEIMDLRCGEHPDDPEPCDECLSLIDEAQRAENDAVHRAEAASGAIEWAAGAEVVVRPLPADVRTEAEAYYRSACDRYVARPAKNGLAAYVRHNYTNYEALLSRLERQFPEAPRGGRAYMEIRERVDFAVQDALDDSDLGFAEADEDGSE